jgi:hypothetical protein
VLWDFSLLLPYTGGCDAVHMQGERQSRAEAQSHLVPAFCAFLAEIRASSGATKSNAPNAHHGMSLPEG